MWCYEEEDDEVYVMFMEKEDDEVYVIFMEKEDDIVFIEDVRCNWKKKM